MAKRILPHHGYGTREIHSTIFVLVLSSILCVMLGCDNYTIKINTYDPDRACNGISYFNSWEANRILGVDMDGSVTWDLLAMDETIIGVANGFRVQPEEGTCVYICNERPMVVNIEDQSALFEGGEHAGHHSIVKTPHGTLMMLAVDLFPIDYEPWYPSTCAHGDVIKEINMETDEVIWEWRLRDYVDPIEHHSDVVIRFNDGCIDWSHGNTVKFIPHYVYNGEVYEVVLYNSAFLNSFWLIHYPSGDILWSVGTHGTIGLPEPPAEPLFCLTHDVDMVENDVFIMYDNGKCRTHSKAVKVRVDPVAGVVEEIWSWTKPLMYDWWGGDANQLPNGNVLLTNVTQGRLIEVTDDGDVVWEMKILRGNMFPYSIYQCQRVPYS